MEECARVLDSGSIADWTAALTRLNVSYASKFQFSETESVRNRLVGSLMSLLRETDNPTIGSDFQAASLQALRIICRETVGIDDLTSPEGIKVVCNLAGLLEEVTDCSTDRMKVQEEALKCLSNLLLKSPPLARVCHAQGVLQGILRRMGRHDDVRLSRGVRFFDARLLFLVTALTVETRSVVNQELSGIPTLVTALELCVLECSGRLAEFSEEKAVLASELLKILYSLTMELKNPEGEDFDALGRLVRVVRLVLLSEHAGWSTGVRSHAINILINMPGGCVAMLVPSISAGDDASTARSVYEEFDVSAVDAVMADLSAVLADVGSMPSTDAAVPILTAVRTVARTCRIIRKYMRAKILPPLQHVTARPEDEGGLKSLLVPLMTSHVTSIKEMVTDFLFILCKENVSRLIKYTGYGNAAGMLFQRGLLSGGKTERSSEYSTDEDTDTDDYLGSEVDPITGGPQRPRVDPMAGMTEDEKEAEAVKLAAMFEQLNSSGFLKMVPVGADGQPLMTPGEDKGQPDSGHLNSYGDNNSDEGDDD